MRRTFAFYRREIRKEPPFALRVSTAQRHTVAPLKMTPEEDLCQIKKVNAVAVFLP